MKKNVISNLSNESDPEASLTVYYKQSTVGFWKNCRHEKGILKCRYILELNLINKWYILKC